MVIERLFQNFSQQPLAELLFSLMLITLILGKVFVMFSCQILQEELNNSKSKKKKFIEIIE